MDRIINVKVNGHYLTKDSNKAGVKGEVNATTLKLHFKKNDEGWNGLAKEVVFRNAKGVNPVRIYLTPEKLTMVGDDLVYSISIPGEAMTEYGWMTFSVKGVDDGVVAKSLSDKLFVNDSCDGSADEPEVPTPSEIDQLRGVLEDILKDIYDALEAAKRAEEILDAIKNEDYWAMISKSYAVGETGRREGEDTDNSKYYYLLARMIATQPFMLEDDVTGDLYKLGVSEGLLYIEKIAGDDGEPPIEGGDSIVPGSGSLSEYIESCGINEAGELVFYTNTGRVLNAGKLPVPTFDHMSEEEKKLFLEELIDYITEGDSETINKFFEDLIEELIDYITVNGDTINIGGKVYVAELRLENGVYISDKTFEDLKPHIAAGEVVVCDFFGADSRTRCHMTTCTDYSASFVMHSVLGADEYFTFTAEGVTHMTADVYQDFIDYINNYINEGGVFDDKFYDDIIDYINEHSWKLDVADIPPYILVKKTEPPLSLTRTVTVHARRYDEIAEVWAEKVTTITLDEDGYPDTVTQDDGTTTRLTWEGFE